VLVEQVMVKVQEPMVKVWALLLVFLGLAPFVADFADLHLTDQLAHFSFQVKVLMEHQITI